MGDALLLDLTRTVSRVGRVATGVDRVELAWLDHALGREGPVFGLVRTSIGFVLIGRAGMAALAAAERGAAPVARGLLSRLSLKLSKERQAALTLVRRHAVARVPRRFLSRAVARLVGGGTYLNVGHANLTRDTLTALARLRRVVMIHDTIPLDHPQWQRRGSVEVFRERFRTALAADLVVTPSRVAAGDVARHASAMGLAAPRIVAAHLGVTPTQPDPHALPAGFRLNRPCFVTLGTIEPRKNHALLLDVWEALGGEAPTLYICGSRGWENAAVFDRLDRGVPGVVELTGLPDGAVAALIAASAGFLFPSRAEGFGLPPIEAAALGVPVVCGDLAIWREVLGDRAVYLDPDDRYHWEKAVRRLAATGEQVRHSPFPVPGWEAHFKAVLSAA